MYEIENGVYRFTVKPRERKPVKEYLSVQGRFWHLTDRDFEMLQEITDREYKHLELMEKLSNEGL